MYKLAVLLLLPILPAEAISAECIVLLHGLARTSNSMNELAEKLTDEGFVVANIDYPSRKMGIPELSEVAVGEGIKQCGKTDSLPISYVTHSLGLPFTHKSTDKNVIESRARSLHT